MELKRVEFAIDRKGYSTIQVDEYISLLLSKYEELEREYTELDKKHRALQLKFEEAKNDENTISTIIVSAQKMADSIIKDAKDKAKAISGTLEESCDEILSAYSEKVKAERDKLRRAEKNVADFKDSLYRAYKEHLDAIELIMPEEKAESKMSDAEDEALVDEALELAKKKYEEAASDDVDFISRQNTSSDEE